MRLGVILQAVLLIGFVTNPVWAQNASPVEPYKGAVDYLGNLDLDNARKWADMVIRDFPDSEEAGKSRLLRVMVTTMKLQTYDMLSRKYAEGIRKGVLLEHKRKNRDLYVEATQKAMTEGERLLVEMADVFPYLGTEMKLRIPKKYDSLDVLKAGYVPHEMLLKGFPPTREEDKRINRHQADMSFCYVMSRVFYGPAPVDDVNTAKMLEKRQILEGNVDWCGVMSVMGNWLIQYGSICKVGWIDLDKMARLRNPNQARKAYEAAGNCFEKIIEMKKDEQYDRGRIKAEERLKEIEEAIKALK